MSEVVKASREDVDHLDVVKRGSEEFVSKTIHVSQSIRDVLWRREFDHFVGLDGLSLSREDSFVLLCNALASGHEYLPLAPCDNFDPKKGCLGHPTEAARKAERERVMRQIDIITVIRSVTGVLNTETLESELAGDLGADSMDLAMILIELEEKFEVTFESDAWKGWRTVGDVVAAVEDANSKRGRGDTGTRGTEEGRS